MKILSRYVLLEFLVPLFYCLAGFVSIYVLFELFGSFARLMDAHLPFAQIALYFAGYLSPYFHYLAPAALMLATLYTMWMFCRHSEIIAMRASGVSFTAIVKPLLAVAILLAAGVYAVNEWFVPEYAAWANQLKTERFDPMQVSKADNIVYRNARAGRTWNIDRVLGRDGTALERVRVTVDRPNGGARLMSVTAPRATYADGEWLFEKPVVQHYDALGQEIASPTPELDALPLRTFSEFGEKPVDFMLQNRPWRYLSIRDRRRYLRTHPEITAAKRAEYTYDVWERLLAPFACLVITLFAIPAGVASGRQSVFRGVLGALGMYFLFYGIDIGLMVVAKTGHCPPVLAAALPYVIFLALGLRSFHRQR